jgi:hypothetical protein
MMSSIMLKMNKYDVEYDRMMSPTVSSTMSSMKNRRYEIRTIEC